MNPHERRVVGSLRAAATGGTWEIDRDGAASEWCVVADHGPGVARALVAKCGTDEVGRRNAAFAVAAGNGAQELLDMVTQAEARAADAEHERDEARARAGVALHERDKARRELADAHHALDAALPGYPKSRTDPASVPDRVRYLATRLDPAAQADDLRGQVERLRKALGMYATGYRSPDAATQVLGELAGEETGA